MEQLDHVERFYLDLNQLGRRFIYQDEGILAGIWPHILAGLATNDKIFVRPFKCIPHIYKHHINIQYIYTAVRETFR